MRGMNFGQRTRFADMFSALGTEPRLRIMRLLLSVHPDGMVLTISLAGTSFPVDSAMQLRS
jgi:hypothetical protein